MAIIFDPEEGRDRRMKMLLDTAVSAMQIQNQKQQLSLETQKLTQQSQQSQVENQINAGRYLGLRQVPSGDMARMSNENQMTSNPNRGAMQQLGGKSYVPDSRLMQMQQKRGGIPRFMQDEEGNMVELPGILVETPQQKMDRKAASPTADQKNALQSNQNAMFVFDELKKLSAGLEELGGYKGLAVTGGNVVTRGKLNPQAQAYADFMPAAAVNLYRGITGDTRLSDYDANRAYGMVWNIGQDGEIKGIKEGAVENLLRARNILLSNNIYANKKDEKITSLDDVSFVSNAVSQGVSEDEIIKFLKSKRKK